MDPLWIEIGSEVQQELGLWTEKEQYVYGATLNQDHSVRTNLAGG